jgi:small-conductance mechanosensitive channel/CRP-like cAMP-binding protein
VRTLHRPFIGLGVLRCFPAVLKEESTLLFVGLPAESDYLEVTQYLKRRYLEDGGQPLHSRCPVDYPAAMEHLLTATIALLLALAGLMAPARDRHVLKACYAAAAFALFTAALARIVGSPITPSFAEQAGWYATWAELLETFWWLAGAHLLIAIMHAWVGADRKLGNSRLATDIIAGAIYVFAALAITNDVLDIPIRGLLATSGVIAIVLGLALQSTLSDVFSGISINIEQPFEVGDMIQLDGVIEGTVTQVNWRATHILTGMDDIAAIPNSVVAKVRIVNRSRPATRRGASLVISLDARTSPDEGIKILHDAALTAAIPLRNPGPTVQCNALRANGVEYEVFFYVGTDTDLGMAKTELIRHIHCSLAWAGIPVARNEGALPVLPDSSDIANRAVRKMRLIGLFEALSAEEIAALAAKITKRSLAAGEVAIAQGMKGDGLFIVESGVLEVTRDRDGDHPAIIGRLGPGEHFGETALLAGEPFGATATAITAATVFIISNADLAPMMKARPALVTEFGHIVERQRRAYAEHVSTAFHSPPPGETSGALLQRIERFFRITSVASH